MKNIKKISAFILIAVMLLSLVACAGGNDKNIVGKWSATIDQSAQLSEEELAQMEALGIDKEAFKATMAFDFKEDGALEITISTALTGDISMDGKYRVKDGKLYSSEAEGSEINEKEYIEYTIDGDKLTFTKLVSEDADANDFMGTTFPLVLEKVK